MNEEKVMQQSKNVYESICSMLDNLEWKYTRHDEDLTITCGVRGDDLPMEMIIIVSPQSQVVSLYPPMPFDIPENKRVDLAVAICMINNNFVNGSFDYDISDGSIRFRLVSSFRESLLSEELFKYMVLVSTQTIDDYNDKFLMLAKDMMTLEQLAKFIMEDK